MKWWKNFIEGQASNRNSAIALSKQMDIALGIAVLAAEVLRNGNTLGDEQESAALSFFKTHFPEIQHQRIISSIRSYFTVGTRPMLKMSCKHLLSEIDISTVPQILRFLMQLAACDDFIHAREMRCIQRIATYLTIDDETFESIALEFTSINNPYAVIGVKPDASFAEVKKAYRLKVLQHHPDKRSANISEEEAAKQFRLIQHAYERIVSGYAY